MSTRKRGSKRKRHRTVQPAQEQPPRPITLNVDRAALAPPGISGTLVTAFEPEHSDSANALTDNRERPFTVHVVLGRGSVLSPHVRLTAEPEDGASLLVLPEGVSTLRIFSSFGPFTVIPNEQRELSIISGKVMATAYNAAVQLFVRATAPFLDHLSFMANVPIPIERVVCTDDDNHVIFASYTSPYTSTIVAENRTTGFESLRPFYALYRESKNTTSDFYRFLCLYKILEGVFDRLRPDIMRRARDSNFRIVTRKERIPDHPELRMFSAELIGKPIKAVFDNVLQQNYRNAVAHMFTNSGEALDVSDYVAAAKFSNVILVAELCAREVLANQEDYERQMQAATAEIAAVNSDTQGSGGAA